MSENNKIKVSFAPGVLEELEASMSEEELQEFLDQLSTMTENGTLFDQSEAVDMQKLKQDDPELYEVLSKQLDGVFTDPENPTIH